MVNTRWGTVVRTQGPEVVVSFDADTDDLSCVLGRRKLLGGRPVVGDHVEVEDGEGDPRGVIVTCSPRTNCLRRAAPSGRGNKVLVANIDLLVIVASAHHPPLRPGLLDRYLVTAEKEHINPLLCFNKWELSNAEDHAVLEVYSALGYASVCTSAKTGAGLEELTAALVGHECAFVGHSGTGKSSLMQRIFPNIAFAVQEVSVRSGKGRHTTTHARLLSLPGGGYLVDTPGIREFGLVDITSDDLDTLYADFREHLGACRYLPCSHTHEPGCAVKDAVDAGDLAALRYDGYCRLYEELAQDESNRYA